MARQGGDAFFSFGTDIAETAAAIQRGMAQITQSLSSARGGNTTQFDEVVKAAQRAATEARAALAGIGNQERAAIQNLSKAGGGSATPNATATSAPALDAQVKALNAAARQRVAADIRARTEGQGLSPTEVNRLVRTGQAQVSASIKELYDKIARSLAAEQGLSPTAFKRGDIPNRFDNARPPVPTGEVRRLATLEARSKSDLGAPVEAAGLRAKLGLEQGQAAKQIATFERQFQRDRVEAFDIQRRRADQIGEQQLVGNLEERRLRGQEIVDARADRKATTRLEQEGNRAANADKRSAARQEKDRVQAETLARIRADSTFQRSGNQFVGPNSVFNVTGAGASLERNQQRADDARQRLADQRESERNRAASRETSLSRLQASRPTGDLIDSFLGGATGRGINSQGFAGNLNGLAQSAGTVIKFTALRDIVNAVTQGVSQLATQSLDFVDSQTAFNIALGDGNQVGQAYINTLSGISREAGANVGAALDTAARAVGAFGSAAGIDKLPQNQQVKAKEQVGAQFTSTASQLRLLTGKDLKDVTGDLIAAGNAFGLLPDQLQQFNDAVVNARKNFGGTPGDISQGVAGFAVVAKQSGLSLNETANIIALAASRLDESGTLVATRLSKAFTIVGGASGKAFISQLNGELTASGKANKTVDPNATGIEQLRQLAAAYKAADSNQQSIISNRLGGVNARELITVLTSIDEVLSANEDSANGAGAAIDEFHQRLSDLTGVLTKLQGDFSNLAVAIFRSGLLDVFGAALKVAEPLLSVVVELVNAYDLLPGPLKEALAITLELVLAQKLLIGLAARGAVLPGPLGRFAGSQALNGGLGRNASSAGRDLNGALLADADVTRRQRLAERLFGNGRDVTVPPVSPTRLGPVPPPAPFGPVPPPPPRPPVRPPAVPFGPLTRSAAVEAERLAGVPVVPLPGTFAAEQKAKGDAVAASAARVARAGEVQVASATRVSEAVEAEALATRNLLLAKGELVALARTELATEAAIQGAHLQVATATDAEALAMQNLARIRAVAAGTGVRAAQQALADAQAAVVGPAGKVERAGFQGGATAAAAGGFVPSSGKGEAALRRAIAAEAELAAAIERVTAAEVQLVAAEAEQQAATAQVTAAQNAAAAATEARQVAVSDLAVAEGDLVLAVESASSKTAAQTTIDQAATAAKVELTAATEALALANAEVAAAGLAAGLVGAAGAAAPAAARVGLGIEQALGAAVAGVASGAAALGRGGLAAAGSLVAGARTAAANPIVAARAAGSTLVQAGASAGRALVSGASAAGTRLAGTPRPADLSGRSGLGVGTGLLLGAAAVFAVYEAQKKVRAILDATDEVTKQLRVAGGTTGAALAQAAADLQTKSKAAKESSSGIFGSALNFLAGDPVGATTKAADAQAKFFSSQAKKIADLTRAAASGRTGTTPVLDITSTDSLAASIKQLTDSGRDATTVFDAFEQALTSLNTKGAQAATSLNAGASQLLALTAGAAEFQALTKITTGGQGGGVTQLIPFKDGKIDNAARARAEASAKVLQGADLTKISNGITDEIDKFRQANGGIIPLEGINQLIELAKQRIIKDFGYANFAKLDAAGKAALLATAEGIRTQFTDAQTTEDPLAALEALIGAAPDIIKANAVRQGQKASLYGTTANDPIGETGQSPSQVDRRQQSQIEGTPPVGPAADGGLVAARATLAGLQKAKADAIKAGATPAGLEALNVQIDTAIQGLQTAMSASIDAATALAVSERPHNKAAQIAAQIQGLKDKLDPTKEGHFTDLEDIQKAQAALNALNASQIDEFQAQIDAQRAEARAPGDAIGKLEDAKNSAEDAYNNLLDDPTAGITELAAAHARMIQATADYVNGSADAADALALAKIDPRNVLEVARKRAQVSADKLKRDLATGVTGGQLVTDTAAATADAIAQAEAEAADTNSANISRIDPRNTTALAVEAKRAADDLVTRLQAAHVTGQVLNDAITAAMKAGIDVLNAMADDFEVMAMGAIDITDPAERARVAAETAKKKADDARASNADPVTQTKLDTDARQAQADAESTALHQRMAIQKSNLDLGRISHQDYIKYLESEQTRLLAIGQLTYEQDQLLREVTQTILDSTKSLGGQFNIGDIKVPTVYEVRSSIANATGGAGPGSRTQNVNVTINGGDINQVKALLVQYFGPQAFATTNVSPPKV